MFNTKKVLICDNLLSLLIYMLTVDKFLNSTLVICSSGIPHQIRNKMKNIVFFPRRKNKILTLIYHLFITTMNSKKIFSSVFKGDVYGHDHLFYSWIAIKNIILIEDGTRNYHKINGKVPGENDAVIKIILTGLVNVPNEIKDKVKVVDLVSLWKEYSYTDKIMINDILNYSFNPIKNRKLFITQPFVDYGMLSKERWAEILNKKIDSSWAIKPHPRDSFDYSIYGCDVLGSEFPMELLYLNCLNEDIEIKTFYSSAAYIFKCFTVEILGTDNIPELERVVGKIPYSRTERDI